MHLTDTVNRLATLRADLAAHAKQAVAREAELRSQIADHQRLLLQAEVGLDDDMIQVAKSVLEVYGRFATAGGERESVRQAAINWLASETKGEGYGSLWYEYFGTKDYDRWHGQRTDCQYGYGPRHGSIIFRIGLTEKTRQREPHQLTEAEIEAAIYYLVNLERIQEVDAKAKEIA